MNLAEDASTPASTSSSRAPSITAFRWRRRTIGWIPWSINTLVRRWPSPRRSDATPVVRTEDTLPGAREIRALAVDAFDDGFSDDDWHHTLGGWHVLARDEALVAHAAVVERVLEVGGSAVRAGYVEGVATTPTRQGEGLGSLVMQRSGSSSRPVRARRVVDGAARVPRTPRLGALARPDVCPARCRHRAHRRRRRRDHGPALRQHIRSRPHVADLLRARPATTGDTGNGARGSVPAESAVRRGADEVEHLARDALGTQHVPSLVGAVRIRQRELATHRRRRSQLRAQSRPPRSADKWNSARASYELAASVGVPLPRLVHFAEHDDHVVRIYEWIDGQTPLAIADDPDCVERLFASLGTAIAKLHSIELDGFSSRLDGSAPSFRSWADYVAYRLEQIQGRCAGLSVLDRRR